MTPWYEQPIDTRAHAGGEIGVDYRWYKPGEFMPFYVPRPEMPQIMDNDAFRTYCDRNAVPVIQQIVDPHVLRAHQRVDMARVKAIPDTVLDIPAWVSSDSYVLDGNHRWTAHARLGIPLHILRLQLTFEPAIALMFKFLKDPQS